MRRPKIEHGEVLLHDPLASWGETSHRAAQPHEIVPALILLIEDLTEEVEELKKWRERAR